MSRGAKGSPVHPTRHVWHTEQPQHHQPAGSQVVTAAWSQSLQALLHLQGIHQHAFPKLQDKVACVCSQSWVWHGRMSECTHSPSFLPGHSLQALEAVKPLLDHLPRYRCPTYIKRSTAQTAMYRSSTGSAPPVPSSASSGGSTCTQKYAHTAPTQEAFSASCH
jgi:hypothetical protein